MTPEMIIRFVADVVLPEQYCAFNVMRMRGNHRHCDHYAREQIGGFGFCKKHAKVIREAAANVEQKEAK